MGSIIEISTQGPIITFVPDDRICNLLGFDNTTIISEYNQPNNPVEILSFDKIFLEKGIAQGMFLKSKKSGIIHNFTMDVDPGYKYNENFRGGVQWYMMNTKAFFQVLILK